MDGLKVNVKGPHKAGLGLLSVEAAGEFLGGISQATIRAWISKGRLQRVKIGRRTFVYEAELRAMVKPEHRIDPANPSARQGAAAPLTVAPPQQTKGKP